MPRTCLVGREYPPADRREVKQDLVLTTSPPPELVLGVIVLTAWTNLIFHHVLPPGSGIPWWTALVDWLRRLVEQWFGAGLGTYLVNPIKYVAIPLLLLLLAGAGWALVLQALIFGVWHLGLGFTNTGHAGLAPAIASTILNQSLVGLALGVLFDRTRNLLVPSVVHIALNSM